MSTAVKEADFDPRELSDLEKAFSLADNIVTKRYITELEKLPLILLEDKDADKQVDVTQRASLFKVNKIVFDRNENNLQKLINTYASAVGIERDIVMIINSDGREVELYLGTNGGTETSSTREATDAFRNTFIGNFPGSLGSSLEIADKQKSTSDSVYSDDDEKTLLDTSEFEELLNQCTSDKYEYVACVSGIASTRDQEDVPNENYIQGIEKLIDAMQGKPFSAVFIANLLSNDKLEDLKAEYELIYSKLVPFLKSDLSFNESSAEGVSKTLSESLSQTVTKSRSSALSSGVSESHAHTEGMALGESRGSGSSAGGSLGLFGTGVNAGMNRSHSRSRTQSFSDTATFGTTDTQTQTIGDSEAKGEIQSIADGTSSTKTTGRTLQVSYINKTIQNLLDKIDEQLERIKESENYGIFASATYFLATEPMDAKLAASTYKALVSGSNSHVESAKINFWQNKGNVETIRSYLKKLQHPQFEFDKENVVTPASIISGRELAVQMGLPRKSVPGVSVIETAAFGRNIDRGEITGHRYIELGNLYHMGKDEGTTNKKNPVKLDLDSLTAHTFITGSTGAGKSNAIYHILEEILKINKQIKDDNQRIHFMVIEPAKGEYKDYFGNYGGGDDEKSGERIKVYGTNKKKTPLLRINPFSFPEDVHVLEHIDRLVEIFTVCWPMYAAMPAVLKDAIERAYINAGWDLTESVCKYEQQFGHPIYPSFVDVLTMINIVMEESKYSSDSKGDYTGALCTRIKSLTNGIYGQIFTSDELTNEELFDSNVIVDLSRVGSTETKALIMGLLIMKMQEYRMSEAIVNNSGLRHLTVLEEAHNLLKRTSTEQDPDSSNLLGKSVEMLANSIAEMRTYGEGFIIADQAPGLLDMAVIRNTNTKIILRLPDLSDRELVGKAAALNDDQITELSKLETGVAAVYQNNWLEPVLCHISSCKDESSAYKYSPENSGDSDDVIISNIIKYVMLPAIEKIKLGEEELSALRDSIYKLPLTSDTKVNLIKYFDESNPENIQRLRNKIIYNIFNSETAISLSSQERKDVHSWIDSMQDKLEPDIKSFSAVEQDKILAIIAHEYAEQKMTPDAVETRDNLLKFIDLERGVK